MNTPAATRRMRDDSDDASEVRLKRQRTALACESCRHRKSRCNGARPVCAPCAGMGFECVYRRPAVTAVSDATTRRPPWEARLRNVERTLEQLVQAIPSRPHEQRGPASHEARRGETTSFTVESSSDTVDGMGSITFTDEAELSYFGPSSNSAYFAHIIKALASHSSRQGVDVTHASAAQDLSEKLSRPSSPVSAQPRTQPGRFNLHWLPSRPDILKGADNYFALTGTLFPFLHRTAVLDVIRTLDLSNLQSVSRATLSLINAILAVGLSLETAGSREPPRPTEGSSHLFFQRAYALLPGSNGNAESASIETVQALAVMAIYLQGTSRAALAWRTHAMLVQAALGLGLHLDDLSQSMTPLDREIRRRTWYICVICDRVLCQTLGRPHLIQHEYSSVPLPCDVDLDDLSQGRKPEGDGTSCGLFIAALKLYAIQGDIIRDFYGSNYSPSSNASFEGIVSGIMRHENSLRQWATRLPPALSFIHHPGAAEGALPRGRLPVLSALRHCGVELLLYRSIIIRYLDGMRDPSVAAEIQGSFDGVGSLIRQSSARSAKKMLDLIDANISEKDVLPAWWYTCYYVFAASLILFGLIVVENFQPSADTEDSRQSHQYLVKAVGLLQDVARDSRIARRCSKYLRRIIQTSAVIARIENSISLPNGHPPANPFHTPSDETPTSAGEAVSDFDGAFFLMDNDLDFLTHLTKMLEQSNPESSIS